MAQKSGVKHRIDAFFVDFYPTNTPSTTHQVLWCRRHLTRYDDFFYRTTFRLI